MRQNEAKIASEWSKKMLQKVKERTPKVVIKLFKEGYESGMGVAHYRDVLEIKFSRRSRK